jgi:predicted SprT family Zn-dependent metalloprotease
MQMKANKIRLEAAEKLEAAGLGTEATRLRQCPITWSSRLTATAGKAHYRPINKVVLSEPILLDPDNEAGFANTVLHELAHIAVGPGKGHGWEWKAMHRRLGGNGKRCHTHEVKALKARRARQQDTWRCATCETVTLVGPGRYKKIVSRQMSYKCPTRGCSGYLRHPDWNARDLARAQAKADRRATDRYVRKLQKRGRRVIAFL